MLTMKLKKSFAVLLSAVLTLSFLPMFATAANASGAPDTLYVGEVNKTGDNLIDRRDDCNGKVTVTSLNNNAYYTIDKEKDVGYVLTFYNNYEISEPVERFGDYYGIFCDGDLTIRVHDSVTIDTNKKFDNKKYSGAYGICVKGTLTLEGDMPDSVMNVCADKTMGQVGAIGIYAESLRMHNIDVRVSGGNTAVESDEAIAMIDAGLYANNTQDMKNAKGEPLFRYGVVTDHFIQLRGNSEVGGKVNIESYDFINDAPHHFDEDVVIYMPSYCFEENDKTGDKTYSGRWRESFDLFADYSKIPSCFKVCKTGKDSVVTVSGDKATLTNRGDVTLTLELVCGRASYVADSYQVSCSLAWWQWLSYIFSGAWLQK